MCKKQWFQAFVFGILIAGVGTSAFAQSHPQCPVQQRQWRIDYLPTDPLGEYTELLDLNNKGEVLGYYSSLFGGYTRPFLWSRQTMQKITPNDPAAFGLRAYSLNDRGVISGYLYGSDGTHGFRYLDGVFTRQPITFAYAINNNRDVAGAMNILPFPMAISKAGGQLVQLPGDPGIYSTFWGNWMEIYEMNDANQIVGASIYQNTPIGDPSGPLAAIWDENHQLHLYGDLTTGGGKALAINEAGDAVGYLAERATLWHNYVPLDITPAGSQFGRAFDINDYGDVIGAGTTFVFLLENGTYYNLATLLGLSGDQMPLPKFINNRGQIAATVYRGNQSHGVLLTPVCP